MMRVPFGNPEVPSSNPGLVTSLSSLYPQNFPLGTILPLPEKKISPWSTRWGCPYVARMQSITLTKFYRNIRHERERLRVK